MPVFLEEPVSYGSHREKIDLKHWQYNNIQKSQGMPVEQTPNSIHF